MSETNIPEGFPEYWAELQESLTDALAQYQRTTPELIELMRTSEYFNTMVRNVFANGWVRRNMAAARELKGE